MTLAISPFQVCNPLLAPSRNSVAQTTPPGIGSPFQQPLFLKAYQIYLNQLPVIPITQARKLVPFDTKYWKGWPTSSNPYMSPTMWYQSAELIILRLRPA